MKPVLLEKQSVAWFRLAECVGRGEKERALGLLRLLTHSFENLAFTKQLEADILSFFEDEQAFVQYIHAAHLYYTEGNVFEASAVYEKILALEQRSEFLERAIDLSMELKDHKRSALYQQKLCKLFLAKGEVAKALQQLKACEGTLDSCQRTDLYKLIVTTALTEKYGHEKTITEYLHKALDGFIRFNSDKELQLFLADLKALNSAWHDDACNYLRR